MNELADLQTCVYWLATLAELWTVSAQPMEQRIDLGSETEREAAAVQLGFLSTVLSRCPYPSLPFSLCSSLSVALKHVMRDTPSITGSEYLAVISSE